ncbi:MAG TPA: glycosyltransferase family 2 protein [Pirellulales bacterium]|nr:glycosyltransferase family 2 protein [Pirellulales bacterium]
MNATKENTLAFVVIGRNEGDRLRGCLESIASAGCAIVYVDSGSTDGSLELAHSLGADVVSLDLREPFTAARARNAGFERLESLIAQGSIARLDFVHFVDGDCQVAPGWVAASLAAMLAHPEAAVICGRRRERFPDRSIYNLLCDVEWNTAVGDVDECGGDALVRVAAMRQVGGYNPRVIAGEDSEMCMRLRSRGWRIVRIDAEMTLHDAAITRFSQWWKRTVRAGHALAERAALHGRTPLRDCVRQRRSTIIWGCLVPLAWLMLLTKSLLWPNLFALAYLALGWRIARYRRKCGDAPRAACFYAAFTILGKLPQMQGLTTYYLNRWRGRTTTIIEYKAEDAVSPGAAHLSQGCA